MNRIKTLPFSKLSLLWHYFPASVLIFLVIEVFKRQFGEQLLAFALYPACLPSHELPDGHSRYSSFLFSPTPAAPWASPKALTTSPLHLTCCLLCGCSHMKLPRAEPWSYLPLRNLSIAPCFLGGVFRNASLSPASIISAIPLHLCAVVYFIFIFKGTDFFPHLNVF